MALCLPCSDGPDCFSFPAGAGIPYWWEGPTHFPDSSSQRVRTAEIGSQLGNIRHTTLAPLPRRRIHNILFGITLYTLLTLITFQITQLLDN